MGRRVMMGVETEGTAWGPVLFTSLGYLCLRPRVLILALCVQYTNILLQNFTLMIICEIRACFFKNTNFVRFQP